MSLNTIPSLGSISNPEDLTSEKTISIPLEELRCKICFQTSRPLVSCCQCSGSIAHAHQSCLLEWIAHTIEKEGYSTVPKCEICKAPFSAQITISRPEFSLQRLLAVTADKKSLMLQVIFSAVAIVLAMIQILAAVIHFQLEEMFLKIVVPLFVAIHSYRFVVTQPFWGRCFVQIIEVVLEPIDVIK